NGAALVNGDAFFLEELPIGAGPVENERVVVGIGPGSGRRGLLRRGCRGADGSSSRSNAGEAHAQELGTRKAYFFDGIAGGLAVGVTVCARLFGAVGMIVVLVVRVLVTVVVMMPPGVSHWDLPLKASCTYNTEKRTAKTARAWWFRAGPLMRASAKATASHVTFDGPASRRYGGCSADKDLRK